MSGLDAASARRRVLVAKVGLDGHDRGVKVVGRVLRDAGYEVIYTGLQQTPEMVLAAARDEDVDLIGLSLLSGAHMTLVPRILDGLRAYGMDTPVVVGGIIPTQDRVALRALGVAAVLTPGASSHDIVEAVATALDQAATETRATQTRATQTSATQTRATQTRATEAPAA